MSWQARVVTPLGRALFKRRSERDTVERLRACFERMTARAPRLPAGTRWEALYVLALTTGMRLGELLALHWQDVSLEACTLQVRSSVYVEHGIAHFSEPKTAHSRRWIALSTVAIDALKAHREILVSEQKALGPHWTDLGLVFPKEDGQPLDGRTLLNGRYQTLLRKAGLPRMRFHDLRHTAATLLLSRGVHLKVVSEMLGHASIAITLDIYSHVVPHMQQQAASVMDDVLKRP